MNNTNVKRIKTNKRKLFRYWLEFLKPYHKLAHKEIEALSLMLYYRHELSREVLNEELVDNILFSQSTRLQIMKDLGGMSNKVFNNLLTSLRKKKVLSKDNKILPSLIPMMDKNSSNFRLIFNFELDETE